MKFVSLEEGLTAGGQIDADEIGRLATEGVRRIVNLRPDGEKPGQLPAAEAARIAAAHGIEYRHIPITMPDLSATQIRMVGNALDHADGPVFAHCGSGQRVATLWALNGVLTGRVDREEAFRRVSQAGFDPAPGSAWLDRHQVAS